MCFILNEITSQVILSATLLISFIISPYCEHTSILFQYGCSLDMVCLIQRSCIPYIVWYIFLERTETCYLITEIFWHLILSSKKACTYMNIDFYWWWDVYDKVLFLYFRAPLLLSLLWIPFFLLCVWVMWPLLYNSPLAKSRNTLLVGENMEGELSYLFFFTWNKISE